MRPGLSFVIFYLLVVTFYHIFPLRKPQMRGKIALSHQKRRKSYVREKNGYD